jgi:hypothetical protein
MRRAIRAWPLDARLDQRMDDLARMLNPIIPGCLTCYGSHYPQAPCERIRHAVETFWGPSGPASRRGSRVQRRRQGGRDPIAVA